MDAAVVDENDPFATDPTLDMYDERNGYRTPPEQSRYDLQWLERYRAAVREMSKSMPVSRTGIQRFTFL